MIEIGAVTFSVASVPSMVPSDFAVRLAIVAMIKTPSVARGPSPMAPTEGVGSRRHRSAAKGEPRTGLTALGDRAPQTGAKEGWFSGDPRSCHGPNSPHLPSRETERNVGARSRHACGIGLVLAGSFAEKTVGSGTGPQSGARRSVGRKASSSGDLRRVSRGQPETAGLAENQCDRKKEG